MNTRNISIAIIVVGLLVELVTAGPQIGTGIAAVGIFAFVYDFFKRRQGPRL